MHLDSLIFRPGSFAGDSRETSHEILARVSVNNESLIFRSGRIYPQSVVGAIWARPWLQPSRYGWFLVKNYVLRRRGERVEAALWVVDNFTPNNYHHWLVDAVGRLVEGEKLYPDQCLLLLPEHYRRHEYVGFSLRAFPRLAVRWISSRSRVPVARLAFVPRSPATVLAAPPTYRSDLLRDAAGRIAALVDEPRMTRGIYFSREDAGRRRARNETEVREVLDDFGIETMLIDPKRPWEQVAASMGASLIVGVHGAALSNLIFLSTGGKVLEFRRREREDLFFFDHYRPLAEAMDVSYRPQFCEIADAVTGWDVNDADLIVDLDLLRENLRQMIG